MPQKSPVRTWGTRFDTLPSSPPPSPQTHETVLGEDASATGNSLDASNVKKVEKLPHDASVFVGSLPTNIEQSELSRLLSEHLSEHAEVKSIKLVKDSKGGVCAFVQCENAASASSLIHTLHSNAPKHFLGRVLRYEPARAFRTLLISYRTPIQFIPSGDRSKGGGENVQLDPPLAMRLWRPRNSKFLSLLYNTEAVDAENHANTNRDSVSDTGLFLQPVVFDEGTIRMLCAHFGPLESFELFKGPDTASDQDANKRYPHPHDGPRLPEMNPGCFEVKWAHRDDCVSALMTLRRVPHLTVTWAHQPSPFGFEQQPPHHQGRFLSGPSNHGTSYPFHVQNFTPPSQPRNESLPTPGTTQLHSSRLSAPGSDVSFSVSSTNTDDWKRITLPLPGQVYDSSASFRSPGFLYASAKGLGSKVEWTDIDFPPLGDSKADRKAEQGVWADKKPCKSGEEGRDRPSSSLSVIIADANNAMITRDSNAASYQDEEQELDILDTPGLGMSPITPKTSGSQFPTTPTSTNGDLQSSSFQSYESKEKNGYFEESKELDPTTLFVGGLEMFGPGAWDEDRVSAFFGKFGGLESVKVVRPLSGRAAFAFVKFNNTESPARAVFEEHNRVHGGRAMRVQLRDCNPPRGGGTWRYGGRARGRFPHSHYGSQRRHPEESDQPHERPTSDFGQDDSGAADEVGEMASLSLGDEKSVKDPVRGVEPADFAVTCVEADLLVMPQPHEDQTQSCPATSRRSSPRPASVPEAPPQPEYREWYDEPASATMTPPLPSLNSSAAVPGAPYPMANGGYYPPPWAQSYAQQIPYGMPYYPGFPGYPMQGAQPPPSQPYSSPGGSDASGPASGPQRPWPSMGMYGAYISYPAYPARANVDQTSPRGQAPLQPTGFIQNEQGTLIPVYQPEALDQYMASNQAAPTTTPPAQPLNGTSTWQPYPPPPPHAFPNPSHPMMGIPPRAFPPQSQTGGNVSWVPGQFPPPQLHSHVTQPPNAPNHPTNFRGGYQDGQGIGPNGRRHPGRRDQHPNAPNNNRNNSGRPMPNRNPRGGMHHMGYAPHGEGTPQMQHLSRPAQFNSGPADWNQWNTSR
ncbi:hypothetical protein C8R44DRAFT_884008 [Mycena epipterygia]|nr:hypothetical protein C8R44DRAFT_884008 [Mycena epipterygia]